MAAQKEAAMQPSTSLFAHFADLEDPRNSAQVEHPLVNIILIAILGVICGADNWVGTERYAKAKQAWLEAFLDLRNGVSVYDTFGGYSAGWMQQRSRSVL